MSITSPYPGVHVVELPSPLHPIVGVPTSVTAFVGTAPEGQVDNPFPVGSFSDYEAQFGGLDDAYPMSWAVWLFFLNGGTSGLIVRVSNPADPLATASLSADIVLHASSPGAWGEQLTATVDTDNLFDPKTNQFNLTIVNGATQAQETYRGANLIKGSPQYLPTLLAASQLVTPDSANEYAQQPKAGATAFAAPAPAAGAPAAAAPAPAAGGDAADEPAAAPAGAPAAAAPAAPLSPIGDPDRKTGMYALTKADIFNILCLPGDPAQTYDPSSVLQTAAAFCLQQRAMLIVDPPDQWFAQPAPLTFQTATATTVIGAGEEAAPNAAIYYPNLTATDATGAAVTVGPCGAVAGQWAATDATRGVWKAPAGTATGLAGISGLTTQVDNDESAIVNPLAINALRSMPEIGPVVWGARTMVGIDQLPNQWKYIPVRRTALFIEESLRRGTQWAVFEPNAEPLWASLRLNVTTFMQQLYRQGAFSGATADQAYLVQCDANNNPPSQVALGIVTILVGFAPLDPAEFVLIQIQQQADQ